MRSESKGRSRAAASGVMGKLAVRLLCKLAVMRILLVNGNTTAAITETCAAAGRAAASPGTRWCPDPALARPVISSRLENANAAHARCALEAMAPWPPGSKAGNGG